MKRSQGVPYLGITAVFVLATASATWIYSDRAARSAADLNRSHTGQGNVHQGGALVGWASGARIVPTDPTTVRFEEISSARKLLFKNPMEYSGYVLRVLQVKQMQYPEIEAVGDKRSVNQPDVTLLEVVAKIERSP